jgi:hypothetical protein
VRLKAPAFAIGFGGAGHGSRLTAGTLVTLALAVGCAKVPASDRATTLALQPAANPIHLAIAGSTSAGAGVAAAGDRVVPPATRRTSTRR